MLRRARPRRRLSLTSLVDVIFLLLLFFMLTSTFSKFAEVPLSTAASGAQAQAQAQPIFVQLFPDRITVNGEPATLETLDLPPALGDTLLIALREDVSAQRLTDLLVALRAFPDVSVTVLGAS